MLQLYDDNVWAHNLVSWQPVFQAAVCYRCNWSGQHT